MLITAGRKLGACVRDVCITKNLPVCGLARAAAKITDMTSMSEPHRFWNLKAFSYFIVQATHFFFRFGDIDNEVVNYKLINVRLESNEEDKVVYRYETLLIKYCCKKKTLAYNVLACI